MATNSTSVDLVIRAKDLTSKTLEQLETTIGKLAAGLDKVDAEGGPAARTFRELNQAAQDFAKVANELTVRKGIAETFREAAAAAESAAAGVEKAQAAQVAYDKSVENVSRRNKAQIAEGKAVAAALREQQSLLAQAERRQANAIRDAGLRGVAIEELVASYDALVAAEKRADDQAVRAETAARQRDEAARAASAQRKADAQEEERVAKKKAELSRIDAEFSEKAARAAELRAKGELAVQNILKAAAAAQEKQQASLRELAAAADRAAAALTKVQTGKIDATPAAKLADEIRGIVDPASKAQASIAGIEQALSEVQALQQRAAKSVLGADDLRKLAEGYQFLGAALKSVQGQAKLVDDFRAAQGEANHLQGALSEVQVKLEGLATAARSANTNDEALARSLKETQAEAARLSAAYERAKGALQGYAQNLSSVGVDTSKLAEEQARLVATAGRLKGAYDAANDGSTRLGRATAQANKEFKNGFELQRTALSLYQRIRGQVLSLTAAYVGLFGVLNEAKAALDATTSAQRVTTQLSVAFGNEPGVVAAEMEFVRGTANKLGLELLSTAQAYGRFAIASQSAGVSAQDTRDIFSKMSGATRVLGLNAEDTSGVFRALEQSLSKGKVQAEELRGQLGDRLPGAIPIFAKAIGVTTSQLDKLLEKGAVKAGPALTLFADEFAKSVQGQIVPASVRMDAELARLRTSLFDFRKLVAESGFQEAVTNAAKALQVFFRSSEGQQLARDLGAAFTGLVAFGQALVPVLTGLVQGFRDLAVGAQTLLDPLLQLTGVAGDATSALKVMGELIAAGVGFAVLRKLALALLPLFTGAGGLVAAFSGAAAGAGGLGAAFAAVAGRGAALLGPAGIFAGLVIALLGIVTAAKNAGSEIDKTLRKREEMDRAAAGATSASGGKAGESAATTEARKLLTEAEVASRAKANELAFAEKFLADSMQRGSLRKAELEALQSEIEISRRSAQQANQEVDIARSRLQREQAAAAPGAARNRALLNATDAELRGAPASISEADRARLRKEATGAAGGDDKEAKRIAKEQAALIKATQGDVGALSLRAAKKEATDLDDALAALNQQYVNLFQDIEKIRAFNPGEAEALKFQAVAEKDRIADKIRADFAVKSASDRVKALEAERDAELELQRIRAGDDPAAQAQLIRDQAATVATYTQRIIEAAQGEEQLALAQNKTLVVAQARAKLTVLGANDPQRAQQQAELKALQLELSRLTAERDARITAAQLQANINDPTGLSARQAEIDLLTEYQARLQDIVTKAREMAVALGDPTIVANLDATAARLTVLDQQTLQVRDSLVQTFASGLVDAFSDANNSFGDFARGFIRNILLMIAQARILQAIQSSSGLGGVFSLLAGAVTGGAGGAAGGASAATGGGFNGIKLHGGGIVGAGGSGTPVLASWFANAPRFHSGGLPGLRADEVPAILQRGEEVLSRNDARNALNGGKGGSGGVTIVNTIDPSEVTSIGLGTPAGQRAVINAIAANRATIKKALA